MSAPVTIESVCPVPLSVELASGGPHRRARLRLQVTPDGSWVISWEAEDWHTGEPMTDQLERHSFDRLEAMARVAARRWILEATGSDIGILGPSRREVAA